VDVTDADQVETAVARVLDRWGRLDALINNAGGAMLPSAPFDSFSREQWTRVIDVNLTAPWICSAAAARPMRSAGYGKIVNVSSTTVSLARPVGLAPYIAAKSGVVGLTRALARELGPHNICVNAIAPGYVPVDTAKAVHSPEAAAALRQQLAAEQCLPRTERPQDLCGTVEFLCSADSDFVTGQVFNVDGGWTHG
jgi:3-oxoacyl-[acyl-carrier protein] reductase